MASSMLESILGMVTPEMKQALATRLGESAGSIQNGLSAATAATLGGLAQNAGDPSFIDQIMQLASRASSQNLLGGLPSIASGGLSGTAGDLVTRFLSVVFGNQQGQAGNQIAQQSGLGLASAAGLLKMAAPLVLGYLAKMHSAGALSASTFGNSLRTEAASLGTVSPAGFARSATTAASETASRSVRAVESRAGALGGSRWAVPAAIVGALLLGWLVFRSMHTGRTVNEAAETASNAVNDAATRASSAAQSAASSVASGVTTSWAELGAPTRVTLPDGTVITVPAHGVEEKLLQYLQTSSSPTGATWFDFDRLLFDSGQASLQPASYDQLNNLAAILKAYPTAKLNLAGHADSTGDAAANQKLSEARASTVVAELAQRGIEPARLTTAGFGEQSPVASNETEEGRQQNRRVSFRVAEK
jgi:outer membrane protein OmpA-like peptidoglycan-associated protein